MGGKIEYRPGLADGRPRGCSTRHAMTGRVARGVAMTSCLVNVEPHVPDPAAMFAIVGNGALRG